MSNKKRMIFISHSTYDKEYVARIVDLLRKQGLDKCQIFCSSYPGYGIPGGVNIFEFLRSRFVEYDLYVLFVISRENYYASPACLNEMGAAWVLGVRSCAILLPGTSPSDLRGAVGSESLAIVLDDDDATYRLTELRDDVLDYLSLSVSSEAAWEYDRNRFIDECRELGKTKRLTFLPGLDIDRYLDDLTDSKVPIAQSLKRAQRVARQLGDHESEQWMSKELAGYDAEDDLPAYRHIRSNGFRYSGISGSMKVNNAMLPLNYLDEDSLEAATNSDVTDDIASIEVMLGDGREITRDLSPLIPIILRNTNGFCQCTNVVQVLPATLLRRIVSVVEQRLLKFFIDAKA